MKNLSLLTLLIFFTTLLNAQNIWTVNNQPSFDADYTSLQEAHDSADAGDIIMLHGSSTSYGNLLVRKRIVVIGPGYFLGQNDAPNTQASPLDAELVSLQFQSNSTGTFNSSGSLVTGVKVSNTVSTSAASQTPINFTVQRCLINYLDINNYASAIIKENFIHYTANNSFPAIQLDGINNTQLTNNIIVRTGGGTNIITTNTSNSGVVDHNIIVAEDDDMDYNLEGDGLSFTNNLLLSDQDITVNGNFGQVLNNLTNGTTFDGIASNITGEEATDIVIGWDNPEGFSPDERLTLTNNSPVLGAGSDGDNIGAFTNSSSYILSGIPFVPNIYAFDAPDFGTTGSGITVNIKAKANN